MKTAIAITATVLLAPIGLLAQDKAEFDPDKANDPKLTEAPLSVIDKLIAMEQDLDKQGKKINWKKHYEAVASGFEVPSDIGDAHACVLIGFKLADATLALKGEDAEAFNDCVATIEKLAVNLDIPKDALNRAYSVKSAVDRNNWLDAFLQLSMMRQDIVRQMEAINGKDRGRGVLVVCGAWMQAARVAYNLISENEMPPSATNYLRAPLFVALMETELNAISDPDLVSSPQVTELKKVTPRIKELVSIDKNPEIPEGQISEKDWEELRDIAGNFFLHQLGAQ